MRAAAAAAVAYAGFSESEKHDPNLWGLSTASIITGTNGNTVAEERVVID